MPQYFPIDTALPSSASPTDLIEFHWGANRIEADFALPNTDEQVLRVSFDATCIVRLLDEMPLSTEEDNGPAEGLVRGHFAKELAEIGMALARELPAQAAAGAEPAARERRGAGASDPALAFARLSRSIRLTLGLQSRIVEGPKVLPQPRAAEPGACAAEASTPPAIEAELEDRRTTGGLRRDMARFIAGTAIEAMEREAPETEHLFDALDARLDREGEDDADFAEVEVEALALAVCRDLGVDPGPEWWREGWGVASASASPGGIGVGGGPRRGAGAREQLFASAAASVMNAAPWAQAPAPGMPRPPPPPPDAAFSLPSGRSGASGPASP